MTSELDEIEKEEFFRLKKVLKVKIRNEELAKLEEAGHTSDNDDEENNNNIAPPPPPPGPPVPTPAPKAATTIPKTATTTTATAAASAKTAAPLPAPKVAATAVGSFADVVSDFVTASAASPAPHHTAAAATTMASPLPTTSHASLPLSPFDDAAVVLPTIASTVAATVAVVGTSADEPPSTTDPFSSF